jgi:hypothetical protein
LCLAYLLFIQTRCLTDSGFFASARALTEKREAEPLIDFRFKVWLAKDTNKFNNLKLGKNPGIPPPARKKSP